MFIYLISNCKTSQLTIFNVVIDDCYYCEYYVIVFHYRLYYKPEKLTVQHFNAFKSSCDQLRRQTLKSISLIITLKGCKSITAFF